MMDERSKVTKEDCNTGQNSKDSENSFIDDSKDTTSLSKSCSNYRYTSEQIEKCFVALLF